MKIVAILAAVFVSALTIWIYAIPTSSLAEPTRFTDHAIVTCGAKVDTVPPANSGQSIRFINDTRTGFEIDTKKNGHVDYIYPATCQLRTVSLPEHQP